MSTFSCAILHAPGRFDREQSLADMMRWLLADTNGAQLNVFRDPCDRDWQEFKTILAIKQWEWSLSTSASHHLFLTDDLRIAPGFWKILDAMATAKPGAIIGLLSNHPRGPRLHADGARWYRCNSWVVGPAYCVPRAALKLFLEWYKGLPDDEECGHRRWFNDDSALNEWNTFHGPGESWHPLPTIIEHRVDVDSTVGHGDRYSRERLSWRYRRVVADDSGAPRGFRWDSHPCLSPLGEMQNPDFWEAPGEMLPVGE